VINALKTGKNVFVEKPLCLKAEELSEIDELMHERHENSHENILMVGYNRRFSPLSRFIKEALTSGPLAAVYTVNAGPIPPNSWIQDPDVGGGRIHGEVCHFIDYLSFLTESPPVSVSASVMESALNLQDTVSITIRYKNGSIGTIHYFANGGRGVPKERIEVFQGGTILHLNDFRELNIFGGRKPKTRRLLHQNKGQRDEVRLFVDSIRCEKPAPIPYRQIYTTSLATFGVIQSIRTGNTVAIVLER
jgi:predicted dehydrogenase